MAEENYITGKKDYLTEDSVIIKLALKECDFSSSGEKKKPSLTEDLEGKLLDDERLKRRQRTTARQKGYRIIVDAYKRYLYNREGAEGKKIERMDYKDLWEKAPEEHEIKITIRRLVKTKTWGLFTKIKEEETTRPINPDSLEEIAKERKQNKLKHFNLLTHTKLGMYGALVDLSFQALQNPNLTIEEGEFLIRNAYLALYISREELPEELYQRFIQIELFQQHGGLPNAPEDVRKAVSKASRAVRSEYRMGYDRKINRTRSSKDIEKELLKKEVEKEIAREDTDQEMEFPEAW